MGVARSASIDFFALGRIGVRQKFADSGRLRQAAGEIEMDATQKFRIGAQPGVRDAVVLHFRKDELVDEVADRDRLGICARRFGRNFSRQFV